MTVQDERGPAPATRAGATRAGAAARSSALRVVVSGFAPLLLVALMAWWFLRFGVDYVRLGPAPVEKLAIERVIFRPQEITLLVRNEGPGPLTVAQLLVNQAMWDFSITPGRELARLQSARISVPFDWIEGDPYVFDVITGTGIRHVRKVEVATATPSVSPRALSIFGLLGVYVGVIPVFLGLLWLPFLRSMPRSWMDFWISLTAGLLAFLAIDTFRESFEVMGRVPEFLNGLMLVALGAIGAFLALTGIDTILRRGSESRPAPARGMALAMMIAIGIGLHNLGEGLAIGAAYTLGEVALGSFLILGFTLHNTTEGLAILSPIVQEEVSWRDLALLGFVGGGPTIVGAWTGAFTYSDPLSLVFLGIGGGAILQVIRVLVRARAESGESAVEALAKPRNIAGLLVGFLLMYLTGLLVAG
ncbi:MAG: ZIP family metal transporter [Candidatus Eisenbacteria bacterium]|uniref:ZIP family metal transporter n=1 Tax=Eiseniibacteriota bacterium TaxID=2212470 RepID=A0A538T6D0_UNCEI|nr:MAG: ZIP family metal transporter [Candidatus Eisenbacteria bacterium]